MCMVHVVLGDSLVNNNKVASGGVLPLLQQKLAQPRDIFYVNFGVWHRKRTEWDRNFKPALEGLGKFYQVGLSAEVQHYQVVQKVLRSEIEWRSECLHWLPWCINSKLSQPVSSL